MSQKFELVSDFQPMGDQPQAIESLLDGLKQGQRYQTLLGATGTGKTYTMAQIIERTQRPTLIMAHNKTLAAQLYSEFKEFFPKNAVNYFVSYYDYYQPEAYIARTDTYIEKDTAINEELDRLRLAATSSLFARRDVIIVALLIPRVPHAAMFGPRRLIRSAFGDPAVRFAQRIRDLKREIQRRRNDLGRFPCTQQRAGVDFRDRDGRQHSRQLCRLLPA